MSLDVSFASNVDEKDRLRADLICGAYGYKFKLSAISVGKDLWGVIDIDRSNNTIVFWSWAFKASPKYALEIIEAVAKTGNVNKR